MGRPKVPKAKLRGIIVNARLSSEEHKAIIEAIKRSSALKFKSEWIRKALLSAAAKAMVSVTWIDKPAS